MNGSGYMIASALFWIGASQTKPGVYTTVVLLACAICFGLGLVRP